jgi:hypothetical protein
MDAAELAAPVPLWATPTHKIAFRMIFAPTSTAQAVARGASIFLLCQKVLLLTMSVTRTAALLTTPPSMTLPLVLPTVVGSPTRAILSLSRAVNPRADRTKVGTIALYCRQQKNES